MVLYSLYKTLWNDITHSLQPSTESSPAWQLTDWIKEKLAHFGSVELTQVALDSLIIFITICTEPLLDNPLTRSVSDIVPVRNTVPSYTKHDRDSLAWPRPPSCLLNVPTTVSGILEHHSQVFHPLVAKWASRRDSVLYPFYGMENIQVNFQTHPAVYCAAYSNCPCRTPLEDGSVPQIISIVVSVYSQWWKL